jgi:hypothetical protein
MLITAQQYTRKGVTHCTLQSKGGEKEYEQNCSYSFLIFSAGETRFTESSLGVTFFL